MSGISNVAADFRKTATGVKLTRMLFDPAMQASLNPVQITGMLRSLGFDLPKEMIVTADVAQIIMSGGALITDIEKGAEIGQMVNPSINIIKVGVDLLEVAGLMSADDPAARLLQFGTDLALVLMSGGTNVLADIGLVLDIIKEAFSFNPPDLTPQLSAQAKNEANNALYRYLYGTGSYTPAKEIKLPMFGNRVLATLPAVTVPPGIIRDQMNRAANRALDFQDKKIDIFEMMGDVAAESPALFYNYFPAMKALLPPSLVTYTATSTVQYHQSTGLFGLGSGRDYKITESASATIEEMLSGRNALQNAILLKYLDDAVHTYQILGVTGLSEKQAGFEGGFKKEYYALLKDYVFGGARQYGGGYAATNPTRPDIPAHPNFVPRIKMEMLCLLHFFPPYLDVVGPRFDIKPYLYNLGVTPNDLGSSVVTDQLTDGFYSPFRDQVYQSDLSSLSHSTQRDPGISFNGVDIFTGSDQKYNQDRIALNKKFVIERALLNKEVRDAVMADRRGDVVSLLNDSKANSIVSEWGFMAYIPNELLPHNYRPVVDYRNLKEYFGLLTIWNLIKNSPFFRDHPLSGVYDYTMKSPDELEAEVRDLQFVAMGRKMNLQAKANVANAFGIPIEKLAFYKTGTGELAKIKG